MKVVSEGFLYRSRSRLEMMRDASWLIGEYVNSHHRTQGMSDEVDTTPFLKSRVIGAPKAIYAVGFLGNGCGHLRTVLTREIIRDV